MDATLLSSRRRNYYLVSHRRDQLIEFIKGLLQDLVEEFRHAEDPRSTRLATAVPTIGSFFTPLPLAEAWLSYDARFHISKRRFVAPSFNEVREMLNTAQILAFRGEPGASATGAAPRKATTLKFISFDGDCTLYSDGKNFQDHELAELILRVLRSGIKVALVTAAGYGYDGSRYATRLLGLLEALVNEAGDVLENFFVVGGECNYLLKLERRDDALHLKSLEDRWAREINAMYDFSEPNVTQLLDTAEAALTEAGDHLGLQNHKIIRKAHAVGMIFPGQEQKRECLDESVLRVQAALKEAKPSIPYCAFNGGSDVWVDVGNKRVGVAGLQSIYDLSPANCLHIGDQFLGTGNDHAARGSGPCLWITKPSETKLVLEEILAVVEPSTATR